MTRIKKEDNLNRSTRNANRTNVKDEYKGLKIFMTVVALLSIAVVAYYVIDIYFLKNPENFFEKHFAIAIVLSLIGIEAICLPTVNGVKFSGESKGDSLMFGVGFLLFLCGLISIIYSFFA